ncbi:MAG: FtsX-like permease family protein [Firmicutes bacterium]|nr:FtsX-like permease family protein [Bacillota bacterium]
MAKSLIRTDLIREINKTKSRFISVVLLIVLAVSFLYGLRISAPDMQASMDAYLDEQGMYDIQILSTLGLTDNDIKAILDVEGIEKAEGVYSIDAIASDGADTAMVVKAISISEQGINMPYLTEGRMPKATNECLVEKKFIKNNDLSLGDTIYLNCEEGTFENALAVTEFTIVGIAEHPLYTSISRGNSTLGNGSVGAIIMIPANACAMEQYTDLYATVKDATKLNAYEGEYESLIEAIVAEIEAIQPKREEARTDEIVGEARDALDDGWNEYLAGESDAQKELNAAKNQLDSAAAKLESGWDDYYSGLEDIAAGKESIAAAEAELESKQQELDAARAEYESGLAQYQSGYAQWESSAAQLEAARQDLINNGVPKEAANAMLANERAQLDAAKSELNKNKAILDQAAADISNGQAQIDSARATLNQEKAKLQKGESDLAAGYNDLKAGEREYQSGLAKYNQGKAEAEAELAEAKAKLDEAEAEINKLKSAVWYVLDRGSNMGFAGYKQDAERMDRLANVIPIVFFLVAALVCLTGMTRMVEEQRIQIGGLKAMGYSKWAIAEKYVGYGLLASIIGSVLGLILGATILPYIITSCWKVMYSYPGVVLTFEFGSALVCILLALGCCAIAALAAVLASLREAPATLMRPKAPKAGKRVFLERIPFLWKHLSFTRKVACRNLLRYKKRFWMTVIGIADCTGLIVTGFGLYNSITDIVDLQFNEVSPYSAVIYTDEDITSEEADQLFDAIEQEPVAQNCTPCYLKTVTLESDAYTLDGNLLAVEDPATLEGFWNFQTRKTKEPLTLDENSVLISEKTAELLELSVGDTIIIGTDDRRGAMMIGGIMENYVNHYVFTTKSYCTETLGFYPSSHQILLKYDESEDWESMGARLLKKEGVAGIYYQSEAKDVVRKQLEGVYPAVVIIIIAAGALAFVVLFNLSDINITERRRELATLRVLGFRDKEMRAYVLRENIILTAIGIALGLLFGYFFHAFVISTVEVDMVMFGRSVHTISYIFSILITIFFASIVNRIAGRSLNKIDMVESMKSVE